jgi:hypothetical protein
MKTKKLAYLFVMFCVVTLTIVTTPAKVAACSGESCGCYDDTPACRAECPPVGDPGSMSCLKSCMTAAVHCAICCCCEDACPTFCG